MALRELLPNWNPTRTQVVASLADGELAEVKDRSGQNGVSADRAQLIGARLEIGRFAARRFRPWRLR